MRHQELQHGGHFATGTKATGTVSYDQQGVLLQVGRGMDQARVLLTPVETDYLISDLKAVLAQLEARKL